MHILLLVHVFISVLMLLSCLGVFVAGWMQKKVEKLRLLTVVGWSTSFLSGITLVLFGGSLTHFCLTISVISLMVIAVDRFYSYRIKSSFASVKN